MNENVQIIKEIIENFLKKIGANFDEILFLKDAEFQGGTRFLIKTNESGILIGVEGTTLYAINHLIKKIVWKKINSQLKEEDRLDFFIDVNDFQGKNIKRIKTQTLDWAEKVILFKRDVEMPPMSSYERMIAHSVLANHPSVFTESVGENEFRRLVIKAK